MADASKLERIYTVPLSKAYDYIRTRRTERAVKLLREFIARHMKVALEGVRISEGVNMLLWRDSIQKPPRKIKVRVVREGEMARAWLPGEEEEMKKKEDERKKVQEAKKKEAEKKEGAKPADKKEEKKEIDAKKDAEEKKEEKKIGETSQIPGRQAPGVEQKARASHQPKEGSREI